MTGEFDLDHFLPQSLAPEQSLSYENLFYVCRTCNLRKHDRLLPDPARALTAESVRVYPDGTLVGLLDDAERIIRRLALNSPAWRQWRRNWIRIIDLAMEHDPQLFANLFGYPDDLPDLRSCRVPENTRPQGIENSHFMRRDRGTLPETYSE